MHVGDPLLVDAVPGPARPTPSRMSSPPDVTVPIRGDPWLDDVFAAGAAEMTKRLNESRGR